MSEDESMFNQWFETYEREKEYTTFKEDEIKSPPSIYYPNYRSVFKDDYPAKFDDGFAELLIQMYTKPNQMVLDPMCGSGVIPLKATMLQRNAIALDVNKQALKLVEQHYKNLRQTYQKDYLGEIYVDQQDATAPCDFIKKNSIDFILFSPPFGLSIDAMHDKYSDSKKDIGNSKTYEAWRLSLSEIFYYLFKYLKPNGIMGVETRPRAKEGHSKPLNVWVTADAVTVGFEFFAEIIEIVHPFRVWSFGKRGLRKPFPCHSYLTLFRKPENSTL